MFIQSRSDADHKNVIEQGFTLVELLIVVVILGILAGIVVFAVGNLTGTASKNACATEGQTFVTAWNAFKASNHGSTPAGATAALAAVTLASTDNGTSGINPGGPYLQSSTLGYNGATADKWAFNTSTGVLTPGANCVGS